MVVSNDIFIIILIIIGVGDGIIHLLFMIIGLWVHPDKNKDLSKPHEQTIFSFLNSGYKLGSTLKISNNETLGNPSIMKSTIYW